MRLEPIILELEREQNDLLIIAHESVLRVLYGYLMACNAADIPFLSFPRNEIIEVCPSVVLSRLSSAGSPKHFQIIPASYNNEAKRIYIPDVPEDIVPASPQDIKIPVPPSGIVTPLPGGLGSPKSGAVTPEIAAASKPHQDVDELHTRIHDVI